MANLDPTLKPLKIETLSTEIETQIGKNDPKAFGAHSVFKAYKAGLVSEELAKETINEYLVQPKKYYSPYTKEEMSKEEYQNMLTKAAMEVAGYPTEEGVKFIQGLHIKADESQFKHGSASKKYILNSEGKLEEVLETPNMIVPLGNYIDPGVKNLLAEVYKNYHEIEEALLTPPAKVGSPKVSKSKAKPKSKEITPEFAAQELWKLGYDLKIEQQQDPWILGVHVYKVNAIPRNDRLYPLNKIVKIEVSNESDAALLKELISENNNKAVITLYYLAKNKLLDGTLFKEEALKEKGPDLYDELNAVTLKVIQPALIKELISSSPLLGYLKEKKLELETKEPISFVGYNDLKGILLNE